MDNATPATAGDSDDSADNGGDYYDYEYDYYYSAEAEKKKLKSRHPKEQLEGKIKKVIHRNRK